MTQELLSEMNGNSAVNEILLSEYLKESAIFNLLPYAVYVCEVNGMIVNYNYKATELWGRIPKKGDERERFSGAYRLYYPAGEHMPHNQTPVAACLKDGSPRKDIEIVIERPDMTYIIVKVNVVPVKDEAGNIVGAINCFHDITEQRKAEEKLARTTKELKDYVENAAIALHWVDGDGIIKWANKAELDLLGYEPHEYIGQHISKFHARKEKISDILQRLGCNEKLDQYETELRCKDGSIKTVHISSNVLWEDGKFIHTRCFTTDVTEQKKLFHSLKESEFRYRQLVESLETPLYTTDAQGKITLYNKAAVNLWGREPKTGEDMWCGSYKIFKLDGSDLPLSECPMAVCLKEQRPVHGEEILVARPDGSIRHVAPYPQPIFDESGEMTGAINMLLDITEIKRTEQALRESEAKYRMLNSSLEEKIEEKMHDLKVKNEELKKSEERYHKMIEEVEDYAIILLDKNGIVQNWNKGAEKIKGYKEEEIIGKSFSEFYLPEDRGNGLPQRLLQEATNKGKAVYEGWRLRKNGSTFWGSIVMTALHNEQNEIIGFSKVTRDLTERKLAEERTKEYAARLEFQNKELEQFAYAASHDLKEPLRKIHLYNSSVLNHNAEILDEKSKEYLNRSMTAVKRMFTLIEELLSYSRTTVGTNEFENVDLNEAITAIEQMNKDAIEENKISIERDHLPTIKGIPFQINQLMENLVNNAIKYKHPLRNVQIQIKSKVVKGSELVEFPAEANRKYQMISIIDNGVGFKPEYAEKIFNIFQRLNNHPNASGSGIGLAICKRILQNHHGFIKASGRENEGARFDLFFPLN